MNDRERFLASMDYAPADRAPNHELGAWLQTRERWKSEAPGETQAFKWNWFDGESALGMDRREFVPVNFGFIPPFEHKIIEQTDRYEVFQDAKGMIRKALRVGQVGGQRMSMDHFIDFPVKGPRDFAEIKKRLVANLPQRVPVGLDERAAQWPERDRPLIIGRNCAINGFYWRAREFMGTENLSLAWYQEPEMMREMMEFFADFVLETIKPILATTDCEYIQFNEDMAMKTGPLMGPDLYREFILTPFKRLIGELRSLGARHIALDTDGNPGPLIPLYLEAGVDILWPLERASNVDPVELRKTYGRDLRLWGGVDKRVLPRGRDAIKAHLKTMIPLIEEGGFIPTLDHTFPPDISWDNFRHYWELKDALIRGDFGALD